MSQGRDGTNRFRIVIIGAGPSGMCVAIKLREAGFDDFVLIERDRGVGGTWRRNTYPGAACDVMSALYSFSFAPKRDWSRPYAPQPEILAYLERLAADRGLLPRCRFETEVTGATWDSERARWDVDLASGESLEADVLIGAIGMFNEIVRPEFEGMENFGGRTFHSAEWDWDFDLAGRNVAVIGSAASAVQLVPEIVKAAGQVYLFQRTANWVLPKQDVPHTPEEMERFGSDLEFSAARRKEVFDRVEKTLTFSDPNMIAASQEIAEKAMEVITDPEVRRKLMPDHPWGCKRPLMSNEFYPAFNRPNLELVTEPIDRIDPDAIVTSDGKRRPIDTLILATGFSAAKFLSVIEVVGRNGLPLSHAWADGAAAHLGITTSGFPNLFMLYGPNTNNGSILTMIENQSDHIVAHLRRMRNEGLAWVDVTREAMDSYNVEIQEAIDGVTVWQANCSGYYRSPSGRVVTQWPHTMDEYRRRSQVISPEDYEVGYLVQGG